MLASRQEAAAAVSTPGRRRRVASRQEAAAAASIPDRSSGDWPLGKEQLLQNQVQVERRRLTVR
jgi:hypothetical protein